MPSPPPRRFRLLPPQTLTRAPGSSDRGPRSESLISCWLRSRSPQSASGIDMKLRFGSHMPTSEYRDLASPDSTMGRRISSIFCVCRSM